MDDTSVPTGGDRSGAVASEPLKDPLLSALRSMRRWTIATTVLVAVMVLVVAGAAGVVAYDSYVSNAPDTSATAIPYDSAPSIKAEITAAYTDQLDWVKVRQVEIGHGSSETPSDTPYAVTYKLKDSAVTFAGLVNDVPDLNQSGLVPTMGTLSDQLSAPELTALMVAWGAHSDKPMGFVYSYAGDNTDYSPGDTIVVDGTSYLVDNLWCVNEGWVPAGNGAEDYLMPDVRDLVFKLDTTSGSFTYIGSEPAQKAVYTSSDDSGA
jgi:hypothetical protein